MTVRWFVRFTGLLRSSGGDSPIEICISEPVPVLGEVEYRCLVRSDLLFEHDVEIAGINEDQAGQLAIEFVTAMLGDAQLTDADGNPADLKWTGGDSVENSDP